MFAVQTQVNTCLHYIIINLHGRPQGGGRGEAPPKPKKIVVEKWCYFAELYKMTEVREDGIESG